MICTEFSSIFHNVFISISHDFSILSISMLVESITVLLNRLPDGRQRACEPLESTPFRSEIVQNNIYNIVSDLHFHECHYFQHVVQLQNALFPGFHVQILVNMLWVLMTHIKALKALALLTSFWEYPIRNESNRPLPLFIRLSTTPFYP